MGRDPLLFSVKCHLLSLPQPQPDFSKCMVGIQSQQLRGCMYRMPAWLLLPGYIYYTQFEVPMCRYGGWVTCLIFPGFLLLSSLGSAQHTQWPANYLHFVEMCSVKGPGPVCMVHHFWSCAAVCPQKRTLGPPSTSTGSLPCATPVHYKMYM